MADAEDKLARKDVTVGWFDQSDVVLTTDLIPEIGSYTSMSYPIAGLHWNYFNNRFTRIFLLLHSQVFSWLIPNKSHERHHRMDDAKCSSIGLLMGILLLAGFSVYCKPSKKCFLVSVLISFR